MPVLGAARPARSRSSAGSQLTSAATVSRTRARLRTVPTERSSRTAGTAARPQSAASSDTAARTE